MLACPAADVARERISQALQHRDGTIHEIRDHVFRASQPGNAPQAPSWPGPVPVT